jgi:hypothetical protein
MVEREDIIGVAMSINKKPTEEMIKYVLDNYESGCKNDPTGSWLEVTEQLIYEFISNIKK